MTMQNFCILSLLLVVNIQLKSTCSALFKENQLKDYRSRLLTSGAEYRHKVLNEDDDEDKKTFSLYEDSRYFDDTPYSNNEIQTFTDVELIRYLLNTYLKKNVFHHETKQKGTPMKYTKRALTMLSRWKPFQIPNAIAGNGHHVIRSSSLISRSDPLNKLQIMGRPFRWG